MEKHWIQFRVFFAVIITTFLFGCKAKVSSTKDFDLSSSGVSTDSCSAVADTAGIFIDQKVAYPVEYERMATSSGGGQKATKIRKVGTTVKQSKRMKAVKGVLAPRFPTGTIAYSIPDTMDFYREYNAVLRISKQEVDSAIRENLGNGAVVVSGTRVSTTMSAELIDMSTDGNFEIRSFSTKEQDIEDLGYTEWKWGVKPLKSGVKSLRMVVKVVVGGSVKDIPVFEKEIYVHARPGKSVLNFFSQYWQWLFATLLIPIFKWLWEKRSKKKGKGKNT